MRMTLSAWEAEGLLRKEEPSPEEIKGFLRKADECIRDAQAGQTPHGQFTAVYGAARFLCTVVLRAAGYRVASAEGHHEMTFSTLPHVMGDAQLGRSRAYDAYRRRRNALEYQPVPTATETEASKFLADVQRFRGEVELWLRQHHPALVAD